jgi:hypothetical protein
LSVAVFGSRITDPSFALLDFIHDRLSVS